MRRKLPPVVTVTICIYLGEMLLWDCLGLELLYEYSKWGALRVKNTATIKLPGGAETVTLLESENNLT